MPSTCTPTVRRCFADRKIAWRCSFWANSYTTKEKKLRPDDEWFTRKLALEDGVTLVVSRTDPFKYVKLVQLLMRNRPDVGALHLVREVRPSSPSSSSAANRHTVRLAVPNTRRPQVAGADRLKTTCARQGVDAIGEYLRGMKLRLESVRGLQYVGKGSPSSGFVGMMLLLQMCHHVGVFGVGQNTASTSWCVAISFSPKVRAPSFSGSNAATNCAAFFWAGTIGRSAILAPAASLGWSRITRSTWRRM